MTMIIKVLICFVLFNLLALTAGIKDENKCPIAALEKVKALENINDELGKQQELLSRTLQEQKSEIERLKALLTASDKGTHGQENSHNVSFSARIGDDRPIAVGQTIPFDDVLNNDGNAYSPLTGIFTTPVAGKYLFSCTITMRGNEIMDASLMKNDDDIGKLWTFKYQNNNADATSITVVVNLDQGDTVYVKFTSGDGNSIQHAGYTYFSGVLILS